MGGRIYITPSCHSFCLTETNNKPETTGTYKLVEEGTLTSTYQQVGGDGYKMIISQAMGMAGGGGGNFNAGGFEWTRTLDFTDSTENVYYTTQLPPISYQTNEPPVGTYGGITITDGDCV